MPLNSSISQKSATGPWICSQTWDFVWILNGLWLAVIFIFINNLMIPVESYPYLQIPRVVLSYSHLVAPIVGVFLLKQFRQAFRIDYGRLIIWPLFWTIIPAVMILAAWLRQDIGFSIFILKILSVVWLLWTNWHFGAQHFGVLSLYRMRVRKFNILEKNLDKYYCLFAAVILMPLATNDVYLNIWTYFNIYSFNLYPIPNLTSVVMTTSVTMTVGLIIFELRKEKYSVPRILYLIMICTQVYAATISFLFYYLFANINHWLVELGLTSKILSYDEAEKKSSNKFFLVYIAAILMTGGFFRYFLQTEDHNNPWLIVYGPTIEGVIQRFDFSDWFILYVFFTIRFLHMVYDRHLYNLKKKETTIVKETFALS